MDGRRCFSRATVSNLPGRRKGLLCLSRCGIFAMLVASRYGRRRSCGRTPFSRSTLCRWKYPSPENDPGCERASASARRGRRGCHRAPAGGRRRGFLRSPLGGRRRGCRRAPFDARRSHGRCRGNQGAAPRSRRSPRAACSLPSIACHHGRGPRRRTRSGVDLFAAPPSEAPSAASLPPRRRVPAPAAPRAHVLDPRRPIALPPCSRATPTASSSRVRPAPPCVCVPYPAANSRAPTLPRSCIRVPRRPRPHGRVSAPMPARPRPRGQGRYHG